MGKSPDDNLEDVAAISGATISVRSMKRAVSNILASLEILRNKDVL
ncbi:MAG: FMN-binding protein [Salegentibacter sp.]